MAHTHEPAPHQHEVAEREVSSAGLMVAVAAIVAILVIGLAVLWAQPWDDDGGVNNTPVDPPITDDSGGSGGSDAPAQPDSGSEGAPGEGGGGEEAPPQ